MSRNMNRRTGNEPLSTRLAWETGRKKGANEVLGPSDRIRSWRHRRHLCDKVPGVRVAQIRTGRQNRRASSALGA
jgi:hypothetical protein